MNGTHVDIGRYPVDGKFYRFIELAGQTKCGENSLRLEVVWKT